MTGGTQDHPHSGLPELLPTADGHRACAACDRVIYSDPKLAAAAIIPHGDGIVLIRRGIEPAYGEWSFPSGYVSRGEVVERAVEREALEETGLKVSAKWLVGLYSRADSPVVLAVYHAEIEGGALVAADEALDVGIFKLDSLPELAFEHDSRILVDWREAALRRD
jgi:ADP-ribose pyrophosphatase YjhB (NUDIX family)